MKIIVLTLAILAATLTTISSEITENDSERFIRSLGSSIVSTFITKNGESNDEMPNPEDGLIGSVFTGEVINRVVQKIFNIIELKINTYVALRKTFSYENIMEWLLIMRRFSNFLVRLGTFMNRYLPYAKVDSSGLSLLTNLFPEISLEDNEEENRYFSEIYGPPGKPYEPPSYVYGPPSTTITNEYGVPTTTSQKPIDNVPSSTEKPGINIPDEYGPPPSESTPPNFVYGPPTSPEVGNEIQHVYGPPTTATTKKPFNIYGPPSSEYGLPYNFESRFKNESEYFSKIVNDIPIKEASRFF